MQHRITDWQPSRSLCSVKAGRALARSGVSYTWLLWVSQGMKTPLILKMLPDAGVGKNKGLSAVSYSPVTATCSVSMGICLPDCSLPIPAS